MSFPGLTEESRKNAKVLLYLYSCKYSCKPKKWDFIYWDYVRFNKRVWEHKNKVVESFTKKYNINKLVYYEQYSDPENAIKREKRLKKYNRKWKLNLIERKNPDWKDLYEEITTGLPEQVGQ